MVLPWEGNIDSFHVEVEGPVSAVTPDSGCFDAAER